MSKNAVPFNNLALKVGGRLGGPHYPPLVISAFYRPWVAKPSTPDFQATLKFENLPIGFYPFYLTVEDLKRLASLFSDASWDGTEDVEMSCLSKEYSVVLRRRKGVVFYQVLKGRKKKFSPRLDFCRLTMVEKELFAVFVSAAALHLSGQDVDAPDFHAWEISAIRNRV